MHPNTSMCLYAYTNNHQLSAVAPRKKETKLYWISVTFLANIYLLVQIWYWVSVVPQFSIRSLLVSGNVLFCVNYLAMKYNIGLIISYFFYYKGNGCH